MWITAFWLIYIIHGVAIFGSRIIPIVAAAHLAGKLHQNKKAPKPEAFYVGGR